VRWRGLAIAIACAAPLLPASTAGAHLPRLSASFKLNAGSGERIEVGTSAHGVRVDLRREPVTTGHYEFSEYKVNGIAESREAIHADLGRFGRIDVRFHPSGPSRVRRNPTFRPGCKGARKLTSRPGTFVGSIDFESEDGRVRVARSRVRGTIGTPATVVCELAGPAIPYRGPLRGVVLGSTEPGNRLGFTAAHEGGRRFASWVAMMKRRIGRVSYVGWVAVRASLATLSVGSNLKSAELTPPRPFLGTATFSRGPENEPFEASLTSGAIFVKFPGMEPVAVTGDRFNYLLTKEP
jgi:hypothetical protein